MITLVTALRQGGEKGRLAEERIQRAFQRFFALEIKKIEAKCNKRREALLTEWRTKNPEAFMVECKLPNITYETAIWEATPTFDLYEPTLVELCIYETFTYPSNLRLAMAIEKLDEEGKTLRLHVFLKNFEEKEENLHWIGFSMTIEEVLFHELLHACGEAPWKGCHNGLIRHNVIGIEAIKQLLGGQNCEVP